jgi:hypothetical protein
LNFAAIPLEGSYLSSRARTNVLPSEISLNWPGGFAGNVLMPFTLAHPAAVLPFRRFCPRFFSFPALVVGSISPDAGYCFGSLHLEDFSHTLAGSIEFCLPVSLVLIGFFYGLRRPVVENLPERQRKLYEPFCLHPVGPPLTVVFSLLAGIWIHLLLDSFTHKQGWLVENLPLLQTPVFYIGTHVCRIFNLLWYICSFAGIAWLYVAWAQWQSTLADISRPITVWRTLGKAALVGALMLPVEFAHHLFPGPLVLCLTAAASALILVAVAWGNQKK